MGTDTEIHLKNQSYLNVSLRNRANIILGNRDIPDIANA